MTDVWKPKRLPAGTNTPQGFVVQHAAARDVFGRWFGLITFCVELDGAYPDLDLWSGVLAEKMQLLHWHKERPSRHGFTGQLWIWYKESDK